MSCPNCSPCATLGLVLAVLGLPLVALVPAADKPELVALEDDEDPPHAEDPLHGMWMRYETRGEGDPLRFWYFHGDGKGLYRYGKVGLANTHSFDYDIEGAELYLRFRKSGEEHVMLVETERDEQGRTWLSLRDDPYEPGARYRKVDADIDFAAATQTWAPAEAGKSLGDRLWIDYRTFASGGAEFHMYQLAKTAIDGRGVGWFHRGDFDNWSTESLTYRIDGERIELFFDIREEPNVTTFRVVNGQRGRELVLDQDPRDYWATHRYRDGGRSFGTSAFDAVLGIEPTLAGLSNCPHAASAAD